MLSSLITACQGLKKMLPEGPAISNTERTSYLENTPHEVIYTGDAKVDFPIMPLQVWAASYELDIILVSKNPKWNMHEYAKLATLEGDLWIMKDAAEPSLDQFITADLDNIEAWLPELPVVRKSYPVEVTDNSTSKMLDLTFGYENIAGEKIKATYKGKYPTTALKKKNGSTMGHSRNQLLVGLDLPYRDFGKKATISYDGEAYKMEKLLGLVPFQMALKQTQGGASSGNFDITYQDNKYQTTHHNNEVAIQQDWEIEQNTATTKISQKNDFRTIEYHYLGAGETLLLQSASVLQWNKKEKGVRIEFSPALPDLRRPFEGEYTSNFVLDIAGQNNNAIGTVTAKWQDGAAILLVNPAAPWWVTDRPMQTTINYESNAAKVAIKMLPLAE